MVPCLAPHLAPLAVWLPCAPCLARLLALRLLTLLPCFLHLCSARCWPRPQQPFPPPPPHHHPSLPLRPLSRLIFALGVRSAAGGPLQAQRRLDRNARQLTAQLPLVRRPQTRCASSNRAGPLRPLSRPLALGSRPLALGSPPVIAKISLFLLPPLPAQPPRHRLNLLPRLALCSPAFLLRSRTRGPLRRRQDAGYGPRPDPPPSMGRIV